MTLAPEVTALLGRYLSVDAPEPGLAAPFAGTSRRGPDRVSGFGRPSLRPAEGEHSQVLVGTGGERAAWRPLAAPWAVGAQRHCALVECEKD